MRSSTLNSRFSACYPGVLHFLDRTNLLFFPMLSWTTLLRRKRCLEHERTHQDTRYNTHVHQQEESDQSSPETMNEDDPNTPAERQSRDRIPQQGELSQPCPPYSHKHRITSVSSTKSLAIASVGCGKSRRRQKPDTRQGIRRDNVYPLYPITLLPRLHDRRTDLAS